MRLDVGAAGLPGLHVQVDLEARLFFAERVRDLDDDGPVIIDMDLAFGTPQELQELLAGFWGHLDPQCSAYDSLWVTSDRLSSLLDLQERPTSAAATLTR
jgi:hypothetical protein